MWWWDRLIDEKIRAAEEQGLFNNLSGQGKPLAKDGDGSGEEWLANHLLKQAGVLPDWLQLRKEIAELRPGVVESLREFWRQAEQLDPGDRKQAALLARLEQRYVKLATEINTRIDEHNLRCPSIAHELPRFQEDAITRARARASSPSCTSA